MSNAPGHPPEGRARRRLLVICHGYPPYYGGGEHVAACLARQARDRFEVSVLTSDIGGRLPPDETIDGVRVFRVPCSKKDWTRHTAFELLSFYRSARRRLRGLMETSRPDRVLAHFAFPAGAVARVVHARYGIPYAVVLHGSDVPGYQPGRFGAVYPWYRPFFRRICGRADRVIAVSDDLAALAGKTWPGEICVILNGVDLSRFQPSGSDAEPKGRLQVVVTAQLIERKGLDDLIEALAALPPALRASFEVGIAGEGPCRQRLESLVRAKGLEGLVRLEGLVKTEDMPGRLSAADLFVLPSLQEGLPLALLEAMASGLPVIATRVGGIPSLLTHRVNALLYDPGDREALGSLLGELMTDSALRRQLALEARKTVAILGWPAVWDRYVRQLLV